MNWKNYEKKARKDYEKAVKKFYKTLYKQMLPYSYPHILIRKKVRKDFSKKDKLAILISQNFCCRICGCYLDVCEFDHIDGNRSNNHWSNCQVLCPTCHRRKTKRKF